MSPRAETRHSGCDDTKLRAELPDLRSDSDGGDNDDDRNLDDSELDALTEKLHRGLALGEEAETQITQTLILLDFNGLLAFRDSKNCGVPGSRRPDFDIPTGKYKNYPCPFYIRPWARELVYALLNDPRCRVAVYTSINERNVKPIIYSFDAHFKKMSDAGKFEPVTVYGSVISTASSIMEESIGLFDRLFNIPDPQVRVCSYSAHVADKSCSLRAQNFWLSFVSSG